MSKATLTKPDRRKSKAATLELLPRLESDGLHISVDDRDKLDNVADALDGFMEILAKTNMAGLYQLLDPHVTELKRACERIKTVAAAARERMTAAEEP